MAEKKEPPYFMYFPGNYRWSAAFINMIGSIAYGGAEMGELHKIGTMLKGKAPDDDAAWFEACLKVADGVRGRAEKFEGGGHRFSAAHAYLRACHGRNPLDNIGPLLHASTRPLASGQGSLSCLFLLGAPSRPSRFMLLTFTRA